MLSRVESAVLYGLQAIKVVIEADSVQGKPSLIIIGLAEKTLEEARERISASLRCCGVRLKCKRTVINLAPADLRKTGSNLELAIAVALFELTKERIFSQPGDIFFGELALNGEVRAIRGALPLVTYAKKNGYKRVFLPRANLAEVEIISGLEIYALEHLQELLDFLQGRVELAVCKGVSYQAKSENEEYSVDFSMIVGQSEGKEALEIAAAGGHNLLFSGTPGTGKSMLAAALPSILPALSEEEALEITAIYSVAGQLGENYGLMTRRPFRAPHHTISTIGLTGGGAQLLPGEISLAHSGVLFLDELAEFRRETLEALRQPLESGVMTINRAHGRVTYPARICLVAATNPCPCGYLGSNKQACRCREYDIRMYQKRLSGPILDRIDMQVCVKEVKIDNLVDTNLGKEEKSAQVRARVIKAREKQRRRWAGLGLGIRLNSQLSSDLVRQYCPMEAQAREHLVTFTQSGVFSARRVFKIIKVARTVADLEAAPVEKITQNHLLKALSFRQLLQQKGRSEY